jgi:CheY-like chemotaxis protein
MTNIILNAVDALPKGGTITISGRTVTRPGAQDSDGKLSHLVLEIADNGIGMEESTRQRCLEPFFSTKKLRGGTGLGLAMVYGAIERHEGQIEILSELNKGTTVRLILPLRESPRPKIDLPTALTRKTSNLRVLCIDDEPLLRELLKEVLESYHCQVQTADGGQAGLDAFESARTGGQAFDAVITDLGMPGVDGRQVAEKIKTSSPATPVILLTGWGTMLEVRGDPVHRVDAILSKPPRTNELVETLANVTGCLSPRNAVPPPSQESAQILNNKN